MPIGRRLTELAMGVRRRSFDWRISRAAASSALDARGGDGGREHAAGGRVPREEACMTSADHIARETEKRERSSRPPSVSSERGFPRSDSGSELLVPSKNRVRPASPPA
jgi:hypothetical protein